MSNESAMRTPLKTVRHLGSAREGTDHFFRQRVTAVANLVLAPLFVALVVLLTGVQYHEAKAVMAYPPIAILMLLFVGVALIHMRLGMQIIIEDYIHAEGLKIVLLLLNTFFVVLVGVVAVYSLLKLSFAH